MVNRTSMAPLLALTLLACSGSGGSPDPATCPQDLPATCPSPAPSYANDVAPILQARCVRCHSAGGEASDRPLDTYAAVSNRRTSVLDQVYACKMPPPGEPQPTPDERQKLLGWLVCRAPQN